MSKTKAQRRTNRQKVKTRNKQKLELKIKNKEQDNINSLMEKIVRDVDGENADILKTVSEPYDLDDDTDKLMSQLNVNELREVLSATKMGVGLAANQIGIAKQSIVWRVRPETPIRHMINPEIIETSEDKDSMHEGCLSYPGYFVEVERSTECTIKFFDENIVEHTETFKGWEARVIQHELDHLRGVCLVGESPEENRTYANNMKK